MEFDYVGTGGAYGSGNGYPTFGRHARRKPKVLTAGVLTDGGALMPERGRWIGGAFVEWEGGNLAIPPKPKPVTYGYVGSGGGVSAGSAPTSMSWSFAIIGRGGATSTGKAVSARAFASVTTKGGIVAGGQAKASRSWASVGKGGSLAAGRARTLDILLVHRQRRELEDKILLAGGDLSLLD